MCIGSFLSGSVPLMVNLSEVIFVAVDYFLFIDEEILFS
jgi:hypothetical protein